MKIPVLTGVLATLVALTATPAQAGPDWLTIEQARRMKAAGPQALRTFHVFVDVPSGFTFVKMPSGWKFVGKLESHELANLPPSVLTSLPPSALTDIEAGAPAPMR